MTAAPAPQLSARHWLWADVIAPFAITRLAVQPLRLLDMWGRHLLLDRLIQVLFWALQVLFWVAWVRFYWVT
jgi:hypothetical protein